MKPVWLLVPAILCSVIAATAAPIIDPEADAILKKYSAWVTASEERHAVVTMSMDMAIMGMNRSLDTKTEIFFKQPNMLNVDTETAGMKGFQLISDGENVYRTLESHNLFSKDPAPATVNDIEMINLGSMPLPGLDSGGNIDLSEMLTREDPYAYLTGKATEITYLGLKEEEDASYQAIKVVTDLMAAELWFTEADQPKLAKMVPDIKAMMQKIAGMSPGLENMDISMVMTVDAFTLEPEFTESTFAYTPSASATEVDDLMEGIMEQQAQEMEQRAQDNLPPGITLGAPAPEINTELLNGEPFKLSDYKGEKVVILDFWASWCGPCVDVMPIIEGIAEEYAEKDVMLIAVNQRESTDVIQEFLDEHGIHATVALDSQAEFGSKYKVRGIPTMVIIDKEGNFAGYFVGFDERGVRRTLDRVTKG